MTSGSGSRDFQANITAVPVAGRQKLDWLMDGQIELYYSHRPTCESIA